MSDPQPIRLPGVPAARPLLIAGPCSAESPEQLLDTARALAAQGVRIFRAGLWKPRTKPGGFEGVGAEGLAWMARVKELTGMYTATEVASRDHVEAALRAGIDLLWIGARTSANPFAVQEIADALAGCDVPVLVKNPVSPDLELWIGAIERLQNAGVHRIAAVHRGFSTCDRTVYRNHPQWALPIELHRRMPHLQQLCDPSHIGGRRDLIAPLSQQAMDLGFDGLMIECHCAPDTARSDAAQQITPAALAALREGLVIRSATRTATTGLDLMREEIDRIDSALLELLSQRMHISRQIARYKAEHGLSVLQSSRYDRMVGQWAAEGERMGMSHRFVEQLLQAIHEESIRQQFDVLARPEDGSK